FGAPLPLADAPTAAVRAALEMHDMVALLNADRQRDCKAAIAIGVGIATGEVFAGYTGTQQRATYTCIGDTVNLAARLEALTMAAGRGILIDGATRAGLSGTVSTAAATQALGEVALKGKSAPTAVFSVCVGDEDRRT
ncbi:MAG: adenylate/guanylate cyclase domain-containing protein, partial [Pseudomonadota bacterium]|nr:adenylate/guanylate cyclase domain-containing protein [Pseudomonadota bacterium]